MYGWIGGSCAQPSVIREARRAIVEDRSRLVRLSPTPGLDPLPPGMVEVPMTCFSGGTIEVYIEPQHHSPDHQSTASLTAVDPVCGMSVEVASARATHEHDGTTYYFCCPGCRGRFAKNPERYLEGAGTDPRP